MTTSAQYTPAAVRESGPAPDAFAITKGDTTVLAQPPRGIYVGTAGDLVITTRSGNVITFVGVAAGSIIPVQPKFVMTASTCGAMVGLV